MLLNGVFTPEVLNNLLLCFLINPDFLLLHTAHLNKSIIFPLLFL